MGATSGRLSSGNSTAGGWFTRVVFFMQATIVDRRAL
jgi:hypothetical protein